jgi:hypothetical protein
MPPADAIGSALSTSVVELQPLAVDGEPLIGERQGWNQADSHIG